MVIGLKILTKFCNLNPNGYLCAEIQKLLGVVE